MSEKITYSYYTSALASQNAFFRLPRALYEKECFRGLSNDAKTLYALMLDRMSLSLANQWLDEDGKVYINYSLEDIMTTLNCGKTNMSKINPILSINLTPEDAIDEMEGYSEIIKENIEYDSLLLAHPYDQEMVEGIFDLILETVLSKNGEITIAGDVYPKNLVKSKFLKLNYSHVEYVINCLGKNTTKVRNIKSYLLASLFNAGSTISSYYRAEVNHDMPQYAG